MDDHDRDDQAEMHLTVGPGATIPPESRYWLYADPDRSPERADTLWLAWLGITWTGPVRRVRR